MLFQPVGPHIYEIIITISRILFTNFLSQFSMSRNRPELVSLICIRQGFLIWFLFTKFQNLQKLRPLTLYFLFPHL